MEEDVERLREQAATLDSDDTSWDLVAQSDGKEIYTSEWKEEHQTVVNTFITIFGPIAKSHAQDRGTRISRALHRNLTWMKKGQMKTKDRTICWLIPCIRRAGSAPIVERAFEGQAQGHPVSWRNAVFLPERSELRLIEGTIKFIGFTFELAQTESYPSRE
ncbi:hypothetical protein Micbo1qcDRAFT_169689 [Microdochium bolleyi]|uniref:Uncharacterized protein n=1 Tax=Microdochium bolleyi TaxID=196109 RepID=A0A136IK96_9PEZI|nr:hypothetical protein Micbo1qcDRAFT_169689 [Microdochium bolleyi]